MAMRQQMRGMTAHQRHKFMMSQYVNFYGGKMPPPPKEETLHTDFDVLRDTYRYPLQHLPGTMDNFER